MDHLPVTAGALDLFLPEVQTIQVLARIDVVATQLRDIERDDLEAFEIELDVVNAAPSRSS